MTFVDVCTTNSFWSVNCPVVVSVQRVLIGNAAKSSRYRMYRRDRSPDGVSRAADRSLRMPPVFVFQWVLEGGGNTSPNASMGAEPIALAPRETMWSSVHMRQLPPRSAPPSAKLVIRRQKPAVGRCTAGSRNFLKVKLSVFCLLAILCVPQKLVRHRR